jgi:hypothetical protein
MQTNRQDKAQQGKIITYKLNKLKQRIYFMAQTKEDKMTKQNERMVPGKILWDMGDDERLLIPLCGSLCGPILCMVYSEKYLSEKVIWL